MRPAFEMFMTPVIGLTCFAVILASWFGGVKYPKNIPAGLVAIFVGTVIAWGSDLFGLNIGGMSLAKLGAAFSNIGFSLPVPAIGHVFSGFEFIGIILVTAIRSASTIWSRRWTMWKAQRPRAITIRLRAC
jgi:AGZA family xanthine/uracil permease-like MFS transporter